MPLPGKTILGLQRRTRAEYIDVTAKSTGNLLLQWSCRIHLCSSSTSRLLLASEKRSQIVHSWAIVGMYTIIMRSKSIKSKERTNNQKMLKKMKNDFGNGRWRAQKRYFAQQNISSFHIDRGSKAYSLLHIFVYRDFALAKHALLHVKNLHSLTDPSWSPSAVRSSIGSIAENTRPNAEAWSS